MTTSSQTLQHQGSPILLLAHLHRSMSHLPAAGFHVSAITPDLLEISLHNDLSAFTVWRTALGLGEPEAKRHRDSSWVTVDGHVDDVPVKLTGFGSEAEVDGYVAELAARAVSA